MWVHTFLLCQHLIKCNGFSTHIMLWPPLNRTLFIDAIGLILAALLCTLCSTTITNYSLNSAQPTTAIIPSRFSMPTTPPSLFRRQWPPPAPNILQQRRGLLVAHWHKEVPFLNQQFGSVLLSTTVTNYSLNPAQPTTAIIPSTLSGYNIGVFWGPYTPSTTQKLYLLAQGVVAHPYNALAWSARPHVGC